MDYSSTDDEDVEELMGMEPVVTLPWEKPLRDTTGIQEGTRDVQDTH